MPGIFEKKWVRTLVKTFKMPLPYPPELRRRYDAIDSGELKGRVFITGGYKTDDAVKNLEGWLNSLGMNPSAQSSFADGIIYLATGIEEVGELTHMYRFFNENLRQLKPNGRIIIIGSQPDERFTLEKYIAQRALSGFTKSLAKEVGKRGATAQLIYVPEGIALQDLKLRVYPLLFFLLSDRSAFITGQVIRIRSKIPAPEHIHLARSLEGKTALVTGGARGIGEAISRILAREGAKVIITDLPAMENQMKQLCDAIQGDYIAMDIAEADTPRVIAEYIAGKYAKLDLLVNNAGITRDKTLIKMPEAYWKSVMEVNLDAAARLTKHLMETVMADGGSIAGLASISGIAGNVGQTNYAASKAGMIGLMQYFALTGAHRGIRANAVAPGFIETPMTAKLPVGVAEAGRLLSALQQAGKPEDVGEAVRFLLSDGACGITGETLRVCGGNYIGA